MDAIFYSVGEIICSGLDALRPCALNKSPANNGMTPKMRYLFSASIAAAIGTVLGTDVAMAANCQRILSFYSSGVTPKTRTPLSGQNALAVSFNEKGGCGWGTGNRQSSLALKPPCIGPRSF